MFFLQKYNVNICYDPERIGCRRCAQHGENGGATSREREKERESMGGGRKGNMKD
jgi:hypothetical protein